MFYAILNIQFVTRARCTTSGAPCSYRLMASDSHLDLSDLSFELDELSSKIRDKDCFQRYDKVSNKRFEPDVPIDDEHTQQGVDKGLKRQVRKVKDLDSEDFDVISVGSPPDKERLNNDFEYPKEVKDAFRGVYYVRCSNQFQ